jgi:hypothetical protein
MRRCAATLSGFHRCSGTSQSIRGKTSGVPSLPGSSRRRTIRGKQDFQPGNAAPDNEEEDKEQDGEDDDKDGDDEEMEDVTPPATVKLEALVSDDYDEVAATVTAWELSRPTRRPSGLDLGWRTSSSSRRWWQSTSRRCHCTRWCRPLHGTTRHQPLRHSTRIQMVPPEVDERQVFVLKKCSCK